MMHATLAVPTGDGPDVVEKVAPALQVSPRCPTCGRESAVLFYPLRYWPDTAPEQRRLVCLVCCPKPGEN
jgi:hypothetical protein